MIRKRTQTAAARNLVELRGRALKNYEVAHEGKSRHAATTSDRCDPMLDREVNKFSTDAKSVHLHHLVLVEFDSARADIGRVPREKRFEVLHKRRILLTSLKRAIICDTSWRPSGYGDFSAKFGHQVGCEDILGLKIGAERVQQWRSLRVAAVAFPWCKSQSSDCHPRAARPSHGILGQSTIFVSNGAIMAPLPEN